MLPDDAAFERLARKWEAEEDRRMNAWIENLFDREKEVDECAE